jgi:hypothetical protein
VTAPVLDVADALVETLNRRPWAQPVAAVRHYRPRYELAELDALRASVVPQSSAGERTSRAGPQQQTFAVAAAFFKRVQLDGDSPVILKNPELDDLVGFVADVADYFLRTPRPLVPYHGAHCVAAAVDPVFSPDELDSEGVFASVVTFTFRHWS